MHADDLSAPAARKVVIADDEADLRDLVALALADRPELEVVGVVGTGEEAVEAATRLDADVVVLDLAMPGRGGAWAATEILRERPETRVVILSAQASRSVARELTAVGVAAVLAKGTPVDDLLAAVLGVQPA